MKLKRLMFLAFIATHFSILAIAQSMTLNSKLIDNKLNISQATIRIKELDLITKTDDSGLFQFENIETGNYTFDIETGKGYEVNLNSSSPTNINWSYVGEVREPVGVNLVKNVSLSTL